MATHRRTRTGCWTCREAGYKCDEQKPHCARCIRLKILCKGYGVKLKWQDGTISTPTKRPRRTKRNTSAEQDVISSPVSAVSFTSNPATLISPRDITSSPESTRSLPLALFASSEPSINLSTIDRWLLHYWVKRLSTLISVAPRKEHTTPFQLHLTAMVHDSAALRSTILSMAANHLALSSNDPSLRIQAYRHQQDAIHELRSIIQDPEQAATEPALATVLMMQVSARLFGNDDDSSAANHLAGAKAMISRRGIVTRSTTSSTRFLLSLFAYHDILSSVSRGAQPLAMHDTNFTAVEGEADMASIASILLAVARISQLQHTMKARRSNSSTDSALTESENAMGRDIQQTLLSMNFTPPSTQDLSHAPSSQNATSENTDILNTAEAYRHAAFIYLYRTWLSIGAPNPISLEHVNQCLYYLSLVPPCSPLASSHTWPLFTAGCEAVEPQQREFVKRRFEDMYLEKKFPSLRRVSRDVEDVWTAKDMEGLGEVGGSGNGARGEKLDCIQVILMRRGREVDLA